MKRVVTLINQLASVSATIAALQVQADNANQTAQRYTEDNKMLKQVNATLFGSRRYIDHDKQHIITLFLFYFNN